MKKLNFSHPLTNKLNQSKMKRNAAAWLLAVPSVFLFFFMVWRPIGQGAVLSFFKLENYKPVEFAGIANYKDVMGDTLFFKTLANTFQYVMWSFIIGFLPPIILAIMINEVVHLKGFIKFALYFPAIVPSVAVSMIWYFMLQPNESGIFNMALSSLGFPMSTWLQNKNLTIPLIILSMTWKSCGSTMILYLATLGGVSQEQYEAAKLDGAGLFSKIRYITLPSIAPVTLLLAIQQIIGVFQVMIEPMTMTDGGPNNASISLALQAYKYAFTYFQPERSLALGFTMFVLLMAFNFIYFKLDKKLQA